MRLWAIAVIGIGCGGSKTDSPADTGGTVSCEEAVFYADADGDGFGDPFSPVSACDAPEEHVDNRDDCDDLDAEQHPGLLWYRDADGDGFGDSETEVESCARPIGYITSAGDCDDLDATRHPDALWYLDADDDGYGDAEASIDACGDVAGAVSSDADCDDGDWLTHPDGNEICDGVDNDCDGDVDDDDDDIDIFSQVPAFRDDDGDGYGTDEYLGRACPGSDLGAELPGDCDDTNAMIYPHRLDYNDDVDSDCDGDVDVYVVSSSTGGFIGDVSSAGFGVLMTTKDVDGDGRHEIITSTYNLDTEITDIGGLRYIPGHVDGDQTAWPADEGRGWTGVLEGGKLGYALDFAGDWDGDGVEDLVAGAPYIHEDYGGVYIFSSDMTDDSVADARWSMVSEEDDAYMGWAVAGLGDIDEDGLDDVLVSARKGDGTGNNLGQVSVILGGGSGEDPPTIYGGTNGDQFGYAMDNVGDVDGDGIDDVLVSSPYGDEDPEVNGGGDVILLSAADLLAETPITEDSIVFYGTVAQEYAGITLVGPGDFDGDGLNDMLIASPNHDLTTEGDEGVSYVVLGSNTGWESTALSDAHLQLQGSTIGSKVGRYVGASGDIDGDGRDEVFVSDYGWDGEEDNMGMVYGILGGHPGGIIDVTLEADLFIQGDGKNDYLARAIAPAGDTDGDGLEDFWVSASGAGSSGTLYLLMGAESPGE